MGYYLECTLILKHGPTLETWVKHTNPKLTRVPPCGFVELKQGDIPADKISIDCKEIHNLVEYYYPVI